MPNTILALVIIITLATQPLLTGCRQPAQKLPESQVDVDLKSTTIQKDGNNGELQAYISESEIKIRDNEIRINILINKKIRRGNLFDVVYEKKINTLELENKNMQIKIEMYGKNRNIHEFFKCEFNSGMDEVEPACDVLTANTNNYTKSHYE